MNPKPKPHPKGYKFPLFKPDEGLSDEVIDALFRQSILPHYPGEHYLAGVRRYTRLVEAELQGNGAGKESRTPRSSAWKAAARPLR